MTDNSMRTRREGEGLTMPFKPMETVARLSYTKLHTKDELATLRRTMVDRLLRTEGASNISEV
jgi:hypothetical protein